MILFLGRSGVRTTGLGLLAVLMLLMPVSYRAGTEVSHSHSILQGIVDTLTGHSHHHDEETVSTTSRFVASPFAPANVPLGSWMTGDASEAASADAGARSGSPDIPEQMGLYSPIESTSPIHELGSLIALLLAGAIRASLWGKANRLLQVCITQDPPPPRPVS